MGLIGGMLGGSIALGFKDRVVAGSIIMTGLRPIKESTSVTQLNVSVVFSPLLSASSALAPHIASATLRSTMAFQNLSGNGLNWVCTQCCSISRSLTSTSSTVLADLTWFV